MRTTIPLLMFCMIGAALYGQTASDLASKYSPVSAYQLRPGILMTAKYADDGQICEAIIEARHYRTPSEIDLSSAIARNKEAELIDELAPPAARGKETSRWLKNSYMAGGVLHLEHDYENVLVVTDGSADSGDEILTIHWKKRTCAVPKSTAWQPPRRTPDFRSNNFHRLSSDSMVKSLGSPCSKALSLSVATATPPQTASHLLRLSSQVKHLQKSA